MSVILIYCIINTRVMSCNYLRHIIYEMQFNDRHAMLYVKNECHLTQLQCNVESSM